MTNEKDPMGRKFQKREFLEVEISENMNLKNKPIENWPIEKCLLNC